MTAGLSPPSPRRHASTCAYHLCDSGLTGLPLYEAQEAFDDAQQALVAAVDAERHP